MIADLNQTKFEQIYGTSINLEMFCDCTNDCWMNIQNLKTGQDQIPYRPYCGPEYEGIMFAGVNLNGGNESETAIEDLVEIAIDDYLMHKKYKIFKSASYGGSPFYYYVPQLAFLFHEYRHNRQIVLDEATVTFEQIIEGYRYCALTNMIKCSTVSPDGRSRPSEAMYRNCLRKFSREIPFFECNALVTFSYFLYPGFADCLGPHDLLKDEGRYRIQSNGSILLLELEHPLSTQISRKDKFQKYSEGIFDLARML